MNPRILYFLLLQQASSFYFLNMRLIFDFDGTITVKDTISTLAKAALTHQQDHHDRNLTPAWDAVVQAYVDDCQAYKDGYPTAEAERRTVAAEVAFLAGSGPVEVASLGRVEASGVFAGLGEEALFAMGRRAVLEGGIGIRDGFGELLAVADGQGWAVGVISVNWSRAFIAGALHQFKTIHPSSIIANDISKAGKVQGPASLSHPLTNCAGKLAVLQDDASLLRNGHRDEATVYFGDSTTDMECLLHGGGIAIASSEDESGLIETLRRVGLATPHVHSSNDTTANVFWARDFHEVIESGVLTRIGVI